MTPQALQSEHVEAGRVPLPVLLFLLGLVFPVFFPAGPLAMNTYRLVLLVLFVPMLINLVTGRAGRILIADIMIIAHAFWMLVVIAYHHGSAVIQFGGSNVVELLGAYLIARVYVRDLPTFYAVMRWLAMSVILSLPFAIAEAITGTPPILQLINRLPYFYGTPILRPEPRLGLERVQFTQANAIHYGIYCSIILSFAVMLWGQIRPGGMMRKLARGGAMCLGTFLSLSSAPLLSMAMQIGFMGWDRVLATLKARWKLFLLMCALAYLSIALLSSRPVINVLMTYLTFNPTNAWWRVAAFEWGSKAVMENPVFGIGLREDWERPAWMHSPSVDNHWLGVAMRYGLVGFLMLAWSVVGMIFAVARAKFEEDELLNRARRCWFFAMWGFIFALATVFMWGMAHSLVFFFLALGSWFVEAKPQTGPGAVATPSAQPASARGPRTALARATPGLPYTRTRRDPARAASQDRQYTRARGPDRPSHTRS